jgi:cell volume regulation protein A
MNSPGASPLFLAPDFILQMGLGALVGLAVGWKLPPLVDRAKSRQRGLIFVVSIAAALIAYGAAEVLGGNGFLAAYVAGIVAGNRTYSAKGTLSTFQDGLAWLAQVVMFLTLGLLVNPTDLIDVLVPGLAITLILMLVARPISVFLCLAAFRRFGWREKLFISWAGLRGAVPIVLATFPMVAGVVGAFTIFNIVFFVVLLSTLIQGPTINWMAERLLVRDLGSCDDR